MIIPDSDTTRVATVRNLRIGTARAISECLDILEKATKARAEPSLLARLATIVGWR